MSANGAMLAQVTLVDGTEITAMAWSCEKFYLDERDSDNNDGNSHGQYCRTICIDISFCFLRISQTYYDTAPLYTRVPFS